MSRNIVALGGGGCKADTEVEGEKGGSRRIMIMTETEGGLQNKLK